MQNNFNLSQVNQVVIFYKIYIRVSQHNYIDLLLIIKYFIKLQYLILQIYNKQNNNQIFDIKILIYNPTQIHYLYFIQHLNLNLNFKQQILNSERLKETDFFEINNMLQYLILNNHLEAAKVYKDVGNLSWKQQLQSTYTKGYRQSFFKIFDLLPNREEKLQFYLRVYFLIYPIHPHINHQNYKNGTIPEKQILSFKDYLDTKGAQLAKTSQFLQFYALPFIKKPLEHATFKTLFTKNWITNLKEKLLTFISIEQQHMKISVKSFALQLNPSSGQKQPVNGNKNVNTPSTLNNNFMPEPSNRKYQQKLKKLQQTNSQLFSSLQQIQQRYKSLEQNHQSMIESFNEYMMQSQNKWFQSYKQLVKTTKGLLQIISSSPIQNPRYERRFIQAKKKIQKYQKFIAKKLDDLMSISQDISIFDKPSMNQISQYTMKSGYTSKSWLPNVMDKNATSNNNNLTSYVQIDEYLGINFGKLNEQFLKLSQESQLTIVAGFCWRIIKSKSKQVRRLYCISLISNNFLGLSNIDHHSKPNNKLLQLQTKYLSKPYLNLSILQLLNYVKVDYYTRKHLFLHHNIAPCLINLMNDSLQKQNDFQKFLICLDILSTISAYKDYRAQLLSTQLPIFLLNVLEAYPKIFQIQQLIELIMMVLINFSSFQQGLKMFQQYENIFSTLSLAFEQQYHHIMMLVNGFYYALLANRRLYQVAIECNMPRFVQQLLSHPQYKQNQRQLKFIQSRLARFVGDGPNAQNFNSNKQTQQLFLIDGQEEEDEIEVIMEEQLDNLQIYIKGHQILSTKYGLKDKQAQNQQLVIKNINQQFVNQMNMKKNQQNKNMSFGNKNNNLNFQKKNVNQQKKQEREREVKTNQKRMHFVIEQIQEIKSQEIQLSMVNMKSNGNNNSNQENNTHKQAKNNTIKQQIYASPDSKSILIQKKQQIQINQQINKEPEQPIPTNTKQSQFMRSMQLNRQKNPNTQPKNAPNYQKQVKQNQYVPNFSPFSPQIGQQKKNRRKQILKQINEEIQIKKNLKAEKTNKNLTTDKKQRVKSASEKNVYNKGELFEQNLAVLRSEEKGNFNKKKQQNGNNHDQQDWNGVAVRKNMHMKVQTNNKVVDQSAKKQIEKQKKAFQSKPRIVRTPPKQENTIA